MGDRSDFTDIDGTVYFADDAWDSASPLHSGQSPSVTQSSGNTAQGHPHAGHPSIGTSPSLFLLPRAAYHPPSSPHTRNEDSSSPPIIPDFPSPPTPNDVPWNVLLSSDSESHPSPMPSQRSRRGRQPTLSNSQISSSQHNSNDVVDLTQEASTPPRTRMPSTSSPRGPNKRRRVGSNASAQPPRRNQRRRIEQNEGVPPDVEEVDLRDVDDDKGLLKVLEDQRMATIKSQQEQASKPVKLATLSCVICMESMTDVTATFCGKQHQNMYFTASCNGFGLILSS